MGRKIIEGSQKRSGRAGRRLIGAALAGAAMAGALALAAAPAEAAPLPTIEPTVENAAPTLDNIKLGIDRAMATNPELGPAGKLALSLFPKY
ncbi:hypothetical protein GTV32_12130 [Gordonia sp. SID5947]|uniref:hypothetical protein n=1 Tax=Gordonia sp. SID5947 TaxID=2690315 RepID=UPI001370DF5D|nr:hypothetical protein [Gordonia sp. SID5947]MYR07005.1 hypothetical protein [Gordonia sp. SID5947]